MSFLAPLFLLGGLAVALPVIFHLARRTARERTVFSSLLFLRPTPPRLTRRNRLEDLVLLALRCLAIGLLALGFARPFFPQTAPEPPSADTARRLLVLLDTSASMRRTGLWPEALGRVERVLRGTGPLDQVALATFDREFRPLVGFQEWAGTSGGERTALARNRLSGITPGWSSTALDQALIRAAELVSESDDQQPAAGKRQVVLITDLQTGSRLGALQGHEWPKGLEVALERLRPRTAGNASLQAAPEPLDTIASPELAVRLRINNSPESPGEEFHLTWARGPDLTVGTNLTVYVPAGQGRVVALPAPPAGSNPDRVLLRGDDEAFDNTLFVAPPSPARVTVLYWGRDTDGDEGQPRYFLERAFRETRRQSVQIVTPAAGGPGPEAASTNAALVVVTDAPVDGRLEAVRQHLERGGTALLVPPDAAAVTALARLPALAGLSAEEGRFATYGLWGQIEFQHPLFAPFADPRFSDFTKIHFWRYRRLDVSAVPGARVLAGFDNGDPALVEVAAGRGRVLLLASGWHPAESQLALSTKFVPLLYAILESSGAARPAAVSHLVGDRVPLTRTAPGTAAASTLTRPDGTKTELAADTPEVGETSAPGHYRIEGGVEPERFVVNLDPAESRTTPLPADELERLGVPAARPAADLQQAAARAARLRDAELESRQKLWRWVILTTLGILILETWLAGWTARLAPTPAPAKA